MSFDGQVLSTGTGFLCESARGVLCLITNRHNVTGRRQDNNAPLSRTGGVPNEIVVRMPRIVQVPVHYGEGTPAGFRLDWDAITVALIAEENPRWIEHPVLGARADLVALPLELGYEPDRNLVCQTHDPIDRQIRLGPTDSVSIIGFPFGESAGRNMAIWVSGTIASEPDVDYNDLPLILVDCRGRPGQSGSPVVAYRNAGMVSLRNGNTAAFSGPVSNFIGIYSGRIRDDSDIGMIWKAQAVNDLLASF